MTSFEDTIAAIATPAGVGAIAIIRISGNNALALVDRIFSGSKPLSECPANTIHYGKIIDKNNSVIDDVLVSVFRAPHSYTGEDTVEINTHGNPLISQKIMELLIQTGVRAAEPGEFSKRAFLNNRMDLSQAEAVADIISARTSASLRGARNQLDGLLSGKVNQLRGELMNASSLLELELDFPDEDVEFIDRTLLHEKLNSISNELDNLLSTYSFGRIIHDGVNVAITGKTNVGKSSLLNYLLKENRAIVSAIPGTTRDVIREELSINGILFRLYDTAGIRSSNDAIESEGVNRSMQTVEDADIVLFMIDVTEKFPADLFDEIKSTAGEKRIIKVYNKCDLPHETQIDGIEISAKTGAGIDQLLASLEKKALGETHYTEQSAIITSARHYESIRNGREMLARASEDIKSKQSGEYISASLRQAENSLSEIIGTITSDDVLNNIFGKFCIGK